MNRQLRERRERVPLTQEELADRIGVSPMSIRRWEGGQRPQPLHIRRLAEVLEATPEDLGLAPGTPENGPYADDVDLTNPVSRRRFLRGVAEIGGAAAAGGLLDDDRLTFALANPDQVDQQAIDDLITLTQLYTRQAQAVAPTVMLGSVLDLMRRIRWLLAGSHPESTRRRLQVLYAENATVAGRLAFWNDDRGQAAALLKLAGQLAQEVDERQLRAVALAFRADLHSTVPYIGTVPNNTNVALALFEEAAALDGPDMPPLLRSWIFGCRAEEFAILKRPRESDRDMELAHTALAAAQPGGGSDQVLDIAVLDIAAAAAGLSGFEGACAIGLGRAREAREAFEAGLKQQSSIGRLSGLAAAYALEGDIESAADLLTRGLDEAVQRRLPTRRRRVEGVRAAFLSRAQDHPAVQRFDERLRTAIG